MTRHVNPPITGHHLLWEGHVRYDSYNSTYSGGCYCGERPPNFPTVSCRAMRAWHVLHKEDLRASGLAPARPAAPA